MSKVKIELDDQEVIEEVINTLERLKRIEDSLEVIKIYIEELKGDDCD
jgi:DNA integrity scanning protein DisA with diadenylate cyclase activity